MLLDQLISTVLWWCVCCLWNQSLRTQQEIPYCSSKFCVIHLSNT